VEKWKIKRFYCAFDGNSAVPPCLTLCPSHSHSPIPMPPPLWQHVCSMCACVWVAPLHSVRVGGCQSVGAKRALKCTKDVHEIKIKHAAIKIKYSCTSKLLMWFLCNPQPSRIYCGFMGAPVGVNCESFWRLNLNLIWGEICDMEGK